MKNSNVFVVILMMFFFGFSAFCTLNGESVLKTGNVESPKISIVSSTVSGMEMSLSITDIESKIRNTKDGEFTSLSFPGARSTGKIGNPQLPCYRTFIEVPFGADPVIRIKDISEESAFVQKPVYPMQAPILKVSGAIEQAKFNYDKAFYETDKFSPEEVVTVREAGIAREHRLFVLQINPVIYNPKTGEVRVRTHVEFEVSFKHPDIGYSLQRLRRFSNPQFEEFIKGNILNYGALESMVDYPPTPIGYLIIVYDGFESNITPFANWKKQKGYFVTVTKTSNIPGGPTTTNIQSYIQDAYNNWAIPPQFVLLVGDEPQIPAFTGTQTGSVTDLYYAAISGSDYIPDLWLGRFSAETGTQVDVEVGKVLDYEHANWTNGTDWLKKAVFMASSDNHNISEGTHRFVIHTYLGPDGYTCDSLWTYYGATTQDTKDAINDGRSLAIYSGHGSETSWADGPPFSQSDVQSLSNLDMYPMVSSHACLTGDFGYSTECFGETWVRVAGKGAISFWGASTYSYWTEDDTLERGMFYEFFVNNITWLAGMQDAGLYHVYLAGSMEQYYYEEYNCFGDPSMMIWTEVPQHLTVTHPAVIPVGPYSIPVNVTVSGSPVDSALVAAIVKSSGSLVTAYTVGGNAILPVNTIGGDSVFITVTGYNLEPYYGVILALSNGPYVGYLKSTIDDIGGGNGDGIANPGETIDWEVWVENFGNATANGVYALLSLSDPYINISVDSSWYGNIAAGDSALGSIPYTFSIANNCPDGHTATFDLAAHDISDSIWVSNPAITVYAPVLIVDDFVIDGSGNGRLDPGETTDIVVTLRNNGGADAASVTGYLFESSPYITVTDPNGTFGDIVSGGTGDNSADPFMVHADAGTPIGENVDFYLEVTSGIYCDTLQFSTVVGAKHYFVWDFDPNTSSGPAIDAALQVCGFSGDYNTSLPIADLNDYLAVFVCVGVYSNNNVITDGSPEATALVNFVNGGGRMYLEGGDVWYFDPQYNSGYDFGPLFGINPTSDGSSDLATVQGQSGTFTTGMNFSYSGENNWIDHISATGSGFLIFENSSPAYDCGVANDAGTYRTVGVSWEFGGLVDGSPPSTKEALADSIMHFFGIFVGVEEEPVNSSSLPKVYGLSQSYPNPSKQSTVISYQLPVKGKVNLRVYDVSGRLVEVMIDRVEEAGYHNERLDTKGYASGVYFYRLSAGGKTFTRKMLVVK